MPSLPILNCPSRPPRYERGATLFVTLIALVILMVIGTSVVVVSRTQFTIAGNLQFQSSALAEAESAVTQAENWIGIPINRDNGGFVARVNGGIYPQGYSPIPNPLTMAWDDNTSTQVVGSPNQRYMIEQLGMYSLAGSSSSSGACQNGSAACPRVNVYRITGRGGNSWGAVKFVQTIFVVRL